MKIAFRALTRVCRSTCQVGEYTIPEGMAIQIDSNQVFQEHKFLLLLWCDFGGDYRTSKIWILSFSFHRCFIFWQVLLDEELWGPEDPKEFVPERYWTTFTLTGDLIERRETREFPYGTLLKIIYNFQVFTRQKVKSSPTGLFTLWWWTKKLCRHEVQHFLHSFEKHQFVSRSEIIHRKINNSSISNDLYS